MNILAAFLMVIGLIIAFFPLSIAFIIKSEANHVIALILPAVGILIFGIGLAIQVDIVAFAWLATR